MVQLISIEHSIHYISPGNLRINSATEKEIFLNHLLGYPQGEKGIRAL
jgi:hypothetical protein